MFDHDLGSTPRKGSGFRGTTKRFVLYILMPQYQKSTTDLADQLQFEHVV